MNKNHLRLNHAISLLAIGLVAAIAWGVIAPGNLSGAGKAAAAPAQKTQEDGHLVVVRSANLGATVVGLSVDGVQVAKINFNGRYDAPLAAGQHVLSTLPIPNREHAVAAQTKVNVQPGKTYTFTAARSDVAIVLR